MCICDMQFFRCICNLRLLLQDDEIRSQYLHRECVGQRASCYTPDTSSSTVTFGKFARIVTHQCHPGAVESIVVLTSAYCP